MLNLHGLFHTDVKDRSAFLDNLDLTESMREELQRAKNEVRIRLKAGIPEVLQKNGYEGEVPIPRFFTQGSWSYKTINSPAKSPQQADLDDGVYLPMGFVSQTARPSHASQLFFAAAEEALAPLVADRGWKMITDKPTCIRLEISVLAHIDIPLYAIPDKDFALMKATRADFAIFADAAMDSAPDRWAALPADKVLLAHREENWKTSDPRPIKDWFLQQVEIKGEQLRHVVRYLKGYRDWKWPEGGPSSILLMVAAAPLFKPQRGRDDLALQQVVLGLPAALRAGVVNPTDKQESLTKRLGPDKVEEAAGAFEEFGKYLTGAIDSSDPQMACNWLIQQLGRRFPNEPGWVKSLSPRDAVAATAAVAGPSELVGRTKSA